MLSTCLPWVTHDIRERGLQRHTEETARLRSCVADPLARGLYQAMLHHEDYVAQVDQVCTHGIETCEPYMDARLISFLIVSPPQYQIRFGTHKFLLREVMQGILPEPIRTRRSKGRIARILFAGIARHHQALRHLIVTMPEELEPFLDAARLAHALDMAAYGGALDQGAFLSALALVLWAHRLPWCEGNLPCIEGPTHFKRKGGEQEDGNGNV